MGSGKSKNTTEVDEKGKKGGSGAKVFWNSDSTEGGVDDRGNPERESFIAFAHKLGHAENFADGN